MTFGGLTLNYDKSSFDISNLGYLVQAINLPNLQLKANEYGATAIVNTDVGTYAYPGLNSRAIPDLETNLIVSFFDTELAVFEVFFIPWLRMVADYQSMETINFPRGNIYIELYDNKNDNVMMKYAIKGVYPVFVSTPDLSYVNNKGVTTRDVRFSYNDMNIATFGKTASVSQQSLLSNSMGGNTNNFGPVRPASKPYNIINEQPIIKPGPYIGNR
jgi:hypothetical protein